MPYHQYQVICHLAKTSHMPSRQNKSYAISPTQIIRHLANTNLKVIYAISTIPSDMPSRKYQLICHLANTKSYAISLTQSHMPSRQPQVICHVAMTATGSYVGHWVFGVLVAESTLLSLSVSTLLSLSTSSLLSPAESHCSMFRATNCNKHQLVIQNRIDLPKQHYVHHVACKVQL